MPLACSQIEESKTSLWSGQMEKLHDDLPKFLKSLTRLLHYKYSQLHDENCFMFDLKLWCGCHQQQLLLFCCCCESHNVQNDTKIDIEVYHKSNKRHAFT